MSYNGYKGRYRSSPGNPAPEPGWGRLVPSRKDTFAGYGDEPSPPRFRGRPVIAYAALCTFVMAFTSSAPAASLPADWQHEQRLDVSAPGLLKLSLPCTTFQILISPKQKGWLRTAARSSRPHSRSKVPTPSSMLL